MRAIVLSCDKYRPIAEHMVCQYREVWPDHPFRFRIPYQEIEGQSGGDVEYLRTPQPIKATVLKLLEDLEDEEWIYWCIDDKYPIAFDMPKVKAIARFVSDAPPAEISSILFCRCRQVLSEEFLTGQQLEGPEGMTLLRRKDYNQIWIHQFMRVNVIRHLFRQFPDELPYAKLMDDLMYRLLPPDSQGLYVTKENLAVFGESTTLGKLTLNCSKSMAAHGIRAAESMPATDIEITMGQLETAEPARRYGAAPRPMKNRAIIVLGMHRSGTSALTGLLNVLGVDLGPDLMPATQENEAGYWEHQKVVAVHDRLLLALGSHWDDPSRLPARWWEFPAVVPYRTELLEIVTRDFAASRLWALKDPRMCRLLPLWTSMLDELECRALWILVTRHPSENIRSLQKRDGFSPEKSELLWLQHTLDAERDTRGRDRVMVTFDQLLDDAPAALRRVGQVLGAPWPAPPEHIEAQIRQFMDPGKRHHRVADAGGLSWWTRDTFEACLSGAAGDEAKMRALLESVSRSFDVADALYRTVIRERGSDMEGQMAEVAANYARQADSLRELQEKYRETREKLVARSAEAKEKGERLRRYEHSIGGRLDRFLGRFRQGRDAPAEEEAFPKPTEPVEVSIIVSASAVPAATAQCLRSIREHAASRDFEVLVVADAVGAGALRHWKNLTIHPIGKARSFGEAHNRAAQKARGMYLVFMQDDMSAAPGWLEALLEPLRTRVDAGLVGTEGGVLSSDGALEIRDQAAQLREADFCTTACFAVVKNLFFQVGGFDGYYRPVEEANFSLKIRQTKRKVLEQPLCRPARQSPRRTIDPKRMESNRRRFLSRWAETLAKRRHDS